MTVRANSAGSAGRLSEMLANTRRIGGIAGIAYVVLFVAGIFMQGGTPMIDDDANAIREFFGDSDKANMYLVADWLIGLAFVVFFLPFISALRSVLGPADPSGGMWARISFAGGILLLAVGLAVSLSWGALALTNAEGMDDSTLLLANRMNIYAFGSGIPFCLAAFMVPASLVIVASGVLWRWLGYAGLVLGLLNILGALWVVQGEQESIFGILGIIGFLGYGLWTLATSIAMLRSATEDRVVVT